MAKAQLKILLLLIVVGITLGTMATAYWMYKKVLQPDTRVREEIAELKRTEAPQIDPGAKRFEAAVALIKQEQIEAGRDALYKLLQQFPDSPTCLEAKRIIGEINMDMLFSPDEKAGKKDYIVQPGDSLLRIATRQNTTVDSLIRINALLSWTLQPGDHLTVVPLDFSVVVDISDKTVTLRRKAGDKEYFFKEYHAVDLRLPAGLKAPAEMEIGGKSAVFDGKQVTATDPRYVDAEKWLPGTRAGVVLRTPLVVKPAPPAEAPAGKEKPKPVEVASAEPVVQESGVFLKSEDLEELFAVVRRGSKLYFVR